MWLRTIFSWVFMSFSLDGWCQIICHTERQSKLCNLKNIWCISRSYCDAIGLEITSNHNRASSLRVSMSHIWYVYMIEEWQCKSIVQPHIGRMYFQLKIFPEIVVWFTYSLCQNKGELLAFTSLQTNFNNRWLKIHSLGYSASGR